MEICRYKSSGQAVLHKRISGTVDTDYVQKLDSGYDDTVGIGPLLQSVRNVVPI
jgi:hypothetical protein